MMTKQEIFSALYSLARVADTMAEAGEGRRASMMMEGIFALAFATKETDVEITGDEFETIVRG